MNYGHFEHALKVHMFRP